MHFAPKCASFNSSSQLPGHPSSTLSDFLLPVGEEREIIEMKTDRRKKNVRHRWCYRSEPFIYCSGSYLFRKSEGWRLSCKLVWHIALAFLLIPQRVVTLPLCSPLIAERGCWQRQLIVSVSWTLCLSMLHSRCRAWWAADLTGIFPLSAIAKSWNLNKWIELSVNYFSWNFWGSWSFSLTGCCAKQDLLIRFVKCRTTLSSLFVMDIMNQL